MIALGRRVSNILAGSPGIVGGPLVWTAHFVTSYVLFSIGCALQWNAATVFGLDVIRLLLLVITAAAVLGLFGLLVISRRRLRRTTTGSRARFTAATAAGLDALSLIAVLWLGLAVLLTAPCE